MRAKRIAKRSLRCIADWKGLYAIRNIGMLYDNGWWSSQKIKESIDGEGNPIPWYTYPFIEFIKERLTDDMEIFEYGSGNSTLWWASRVNNITSCEHDETWYKKMAGLAPDNAELIYKELDPGGEYSRVISNYENRFDIVIIDGRDRVNCVKNALNALKDGSVIIWDNTDRKEYAEGLDYLEENGFRRLDFWGLAPILVAKSCTTVFYRKNNCLGI